MIARVVTWISTLAALVLLISFALFAIDQARSGSEQQLERLATGHGPAAQPKASANVNQADPPPRVERIRERRHGDVREAIDDADDVLVSPFATLVSSDSIWAQRGVPSLVAFLLFAVGLRLLAAYLPGGGRR